MIIDWGAARGATPVVDAWQIAGLNILDFGPVTVAIASGLVSVAISATFPGIALSESQPGIALSATQPAITITAEVG